MRLLTFVLFGLLCSCRVSNRVYNPWVAPVAGGPKEMSIVAVETTRTTQGKKVVYQADKVEPTCDPNPKPASGKPHACMAFIEFDEVGEFWDREQLTQALALIKRAKAINDHTIVVTFTHGWKNNADDRPDRQNHNVVGFEGVLENLRGLPKYADYPIVGVYLSWRGDLIPEAWPIRRQLSVANREATAARIPGASMTAALTQIMIETHRPPARQTSSAGHIIMVGHSFGGLALERALSQAMTDFVLRSLRTDGTPTGALGAWADLVVFVNSAAAATEGKQMLDFLQQQQVSYRSPYREGQDPNNRTAERPLLVSISSLGDAATRFGVPVGHGLSFLSRKIDGSWRTYGSQVDSRPPGGTPLAVELPQAQSAYYMSTTAHMEALQSHLIVNWDDPKDKARCEMGAGGSSSIVPFGKPFPVVQGTNTLHYQICEKPKRWNDTLYWAMQMPATIVPDHGKIFNLNFVALLDSFFLNDDEMRMPEMRPNVTRKQAK